MKWYRAGIMRKQFDILPTIFVRWFIGYQGTRKFDIGCSWLCFYFQTNQYGKDAMKGRELKQKVYSETLRILKQIEL